jgi:hypothetical protein
MHLLLTQRFVWYQADFAKVGLGRLRHIAELRHDYGDAVTLYTRSG